ncbi:MAG: DUF4239 domain-containing protein [Planctomycetes bacterium]|nr:DUF4239 domain-containing protein [Planctomycetota bacterium]
MLGALALGRRLGLRFRAADPGGKEGGATIDGAMFGLLGLLLAFVFSGASSRLDARRALIVDEANAIGTAWSRLDLLAPAHQRDLRDHLRHYLDERLAAYRTLDGHPVAKDVFAAANALQGTIWTAAVAGVRASDAAPSASNLLLPALNAMFDISTARASAMNTHPPTIVYWMLLAIAWVASLFAGIGIGFAGARRRLHMVAFAVVISGTVFVTIDIEHPRHGFVRIDAHDQLLLDVRAAMK